MKYFNFLMFILLLMANFVSGQTANNEKFQIYAPNTYALGKYGDVPVDLAHGLPQINIPLMSLTDKDVSVNLSLSYHASGVKVDQDASWVGLGWSLNAGGMITRQVRGRPDEEVWHGEFWRTSISDYSGNMNAETYGSMVEYDLKQAASNATDNEPDVFIFNFCGKSGKFFLDKNAKACFAEYEDYIVQFTPGTFPFAESYFIITDDSGIKYEFRDREYTTNNTNTIVSAWYLSKITSPSGGSITFTYVNGGTSATRPVSRAYNVCFMGINSEDGRHTIPSKYQGPTFSSNVEIGGIVPSKITSSSGNFIEFKFNPNVRKDADLSQGNNQLDGLVLKDANNELQKYMKLNYNYFEANNSQKISGSYSYLNYRLRLESVQEVSKNGIAESPYTFTYFGDNDPTTDDPYTLPYRLSPNQDHWGYYNNANNSSIFPNNASGDLFNVDEWFYEFLPFKSSGVGTSSSIVDGGGTREPNPEAIKACVLKKISYPTGGSVEFDFENQYQDVASYLYEYPMAGKAGGLRLKSLKTLENGVERIKNYTYTVAYSPGTIVNNKYYSLYHQSFQLNVPGNPELMTTFGVPAELAYNYGDFLRIDCFPQVKLGDAEGALYTQVKETIPQNGYTEYNYSFVGDITEGGSQNIDGVPTPGLLYSEGVVTRTMSDRYTAQYIPKLISSKAFPYPEKVNNDWRSGRLLYKRVFNEDAQLLEEDSCEYDIRALKALPLYKVISINDYEYIYARSYSIAGLVKLKREVNRFLDNNGNVVRKVKEYDYASPFHKHITETKEYNSKNDALITKYYYPTDYGTVFTALKDNNIITPVDVRKYKNNRLIGGTQIEFNGKGLPLARFKAEPITIDIAFNSQNPFTFSPYMWNTYSSATNNLQTCKTRDNINTVYLWGYNHEYPIAEINNATYSQVESVLNSGFISYLEGNPSDASIQSMGSSLRSGLPSAQVTTYTYKPLIGMTSKTDPRGVTTYYEYDTFNRLKCIKDTNGKILQQFDYHYSQQQ